MALRWSSRKALLGPILTMPLAMATVVLGLSASNPAALAQSPGPGSLVLTTSTGQQVTLPLSSYSFALGNSANTGSQSSGAGAGKVSFQPLSVTTNVDVNSPLIFQFTATGTPLTSATLAVATADGGVETFDFHLVVVESVAFQSSRGASPDETIQFEYGELELTYQEQAGGATSSSFGWNEVTNSAS
jgi:type VI protein secretion system component Hcp